MRITPIAIPVLALFLSGCNAAQTQPQSGEGSANPAADAQPRSSSSESSSESSQNPAPSGRNNANAEMAGAIQTGFDQLSGRLTLLQEQVLQIRSSNQQLREQNQMLLNRLELLTRTQPEDSAAEGEMSADAGGTEQLDAAIGQLMQILNQAELPSGSGQGQFGLATTYTQGGDWVLLRYDRSTGETWMAEFGDWQLISEELPPENSLYDIQISRADRNTAGYVAVRIDLNSGRSWWLNGKRWQEY